MLFRSPDGGCTFPAANGGWIYVGNSEVDSGKGGASSIVFDAAGNITGAYRILSGTSRNCAGGPTPWGTYLSGEENFAGYFSAGESPSAHEKRWGIRKGGWGYRWVPWRRGSAAVMRAGSGFRFDFANGKVFVVTVDDADAGLEIIRGVLATK